MTRQDKQGEDGRVEVTVVNGVKITTTYDADGKMVNVEKRIKPKGDPRRGGPAENREKRPS